MDRTPENTRRVNLRNIIKNRGFKSITAFAKHYGLFTSNLSLILNGTREFTDRLARNIESKLDFTPGELSKYDDTEYSEAKLLTPSA